MNDFPYLAPPEDGLRRAFSDARRRRFRTAGFSTSGVAAAVVLVAALVGGEGTQSLVQQPAPEQPAVTHVVPDGGTANRTAPRPNQAAAAQVGASRPKAAGYAPAAVLLPTSTSGQQHRGEARATRYVAGPIDRQDNLGSIPQPCSISTSGAAPLCPWANVQGDGSQANPFVFQAEICSNRTSLTLLHYRGANEVDLVVSRVPAKGLPIEVWRWSATNPDTPRPHTIGLEAASCTDWVFTWTKVTSRGAPLGPGSYQLSARFLADELRGVAADPVTFTIH